MSIGKLILHSSSTESPLSVKETLIHSLQEMGLLGQPMDAGGNNFFTGEHFLQLISFVGCSTNVCLAPTPDRDNEFCHLTVKGPFNQPQLFWDQNGRPPSCPTCGKSMADWQHNMHSKMIKCVQCGNDARLDEITWGRHAGYGRIFIEIHNVFPGEARPAHSLLDSLGRLTGTEWNYFFAGA